MIKILGNPDIGVIVCQYLGAVLLGSFFLALGIFISGFCKDQIVSFIVAMMACFVFFLVGIDFTAASLDGWLPGLGSFIKTRHSGQGAKFAEGVLIEACEAAEKNPSCEYVLYIDNVDGAEAKIRNGILNNFLEKVHVEVVAYA